MDNGSNAQNLQTVWQNLSQSKRPDGRGSIFAFAAPTSGVGASYVVREMAMTAAQNMPQDKQVLVVDMDIQSSAQSNWFFSPQSQSYYGAPEGPYDACFGTVPFWRVSPSMVDGYGQNLSDAHFMSLHTVRALRLAFTNFQWSQFRPGQTAHIQNARNYWHKLREHFGAIFVDTPALDRANIISTICPEADKTILVCKTGDANSNALGNAYTQISTLNGCCAGVIFNDPPLRHSGYGGNP